MKRTFSLVALVFALVCSAQAAELRTYASGAWYDTKVELGRVRGAGELRLWFYTDGTIAAEFYYNGNLIRTGNGTWTDVIGFKKKVLIVATDGQVLRGTLNTFGSLDFASGTYRGNGDVGKWQALQPPN